MSNQDFTTVIDGFQVVAQVASARSVGNSANARLIHYIRSQMALEYMASRRDDYDRDDEQPSVDTRNERDSQLEDTVDPFLEDSNYDPKETDLDLVRYHCQAMAGAYVWADCTVKTVNKTSRSRLMTPDQMIDFFLNQEESGPGQAFIDAMSDATGISADDLAKFDQIIRADNKSRIKERRPEIVSRFNELVTTASGYVEAWMPLMEPVNIHQLAVKAFHGLKREKDRSIYRAMRNKSFSDIGDIPLLDDAMAQLRPWIDDLEAELTTELDQAMNDGRNIQSIDD